MVYETSTPRSIFIDRRKLMTATITTTTITTIAAAATAGSIYTTAS